MRRGALLAVAGLVATGGAAVAQGPLPVTGELQVNTYTTGDQDAPDVAMADDGTHVVVWRSAGQDGDGRAVRFRRFPGDGTAPFGEGALSQTTAGDQERPRISMNATRDWVASWEHFNPIQGITARRTSNGGSTLSNEFAASQGNASLQFSNPARSDDGAFVVVWLAAAEGKFRRFDAAGAALGGDEEVTPGAGLSRSPAIASTSDGGFVVAYHDADSDGQGIFAQRFDSGGLPVGAQVPAAEFETGSQQFAAVATAPDDGFVVVWDDQLLGARLRRFDADGLARGDEESVGGSSNANDLNIDAAPSGAFVVVFVGGEIQAREYDRLGRPVGDLFQVNTTTSGTQAAATVGVGVDRFVVAWHSLTVDGSGAGVVRRIFRLRSIFADDLESGDTTGWSTTAF